jgi:hypothetical protein
MINLDNDPKFQQELNQFLQKEYIEDDFLIDAELDDGIAPIGNYAILDKDEWVSWYCDVNDESIDDKSLKKIDNLEIANLLKYVDYGMNNSTGLFDGEVLSTLQVNVASLEEIIKGFEFVSKGNYVFLYTVAVHNERTIPTITTKVNPTGTQIIPKYYTVKWTKLNRNYNDA